MEVEGAHSNDEVTVAGTCMCICTVPGKVTCMSQTFLATTRVTTNISVKQLASESVQKLKPAPTLASLLTSDPSVPQNSPSLQPPSQNDVGHSVQCVQIDKVPTTVNSRTDSLPECTEYYPKTPQHSMPSTKNDSPPLFPVGHKSPPSPVVSISSSPERNDPQLWIPKFDLFLQDKQVLESKRWLNDGIIFAAQSLLSLQTNREVSGWQSTQLSKSKTLFRPIPPGPFIQILHISECCCVNTQHGGSILTLLASTTVSSIT